jgi:putative transposase
MPRASLFRTNIFAYHVTVRSNNKDWFYIPQAEVWSIHEKTWKKTFNHYNFLIHSYVLMSNHFHLIISTPNEDLDLIMRYFLTESSRSIQKAAQRINHIYGGRYKWSVLHSSLALAYAYKYVHRNPVRADMCAKVEDYIFNAHFSANKRIPLTEGFNQYWSLIPKGEDILLEWLNTPSSKESEALIAGALRRYNFQFSKDNKLQKNLRALQDTYGVE